MFITIGELHKLIFEATNRKKYITPEFRAEINAMLDIDGKSLRPQVVAAMSQALRTGELRPFKGKVYRGIALSSRELKQILGSSATDKNHARHDSDGEESFDVNYVYSSQTSSSWTKSHYVATDFAANSVRPGKLYAVTLTASGASNTLVSTRQFASEVEFDHEDEVIALGSVRVTKLSWKLFH